jgi:hypothetical protein
MKARILRVAALARRIPSSVDNALIGASTLLAIGIANATSTTPAALGTAFTTGGQSGTDITTDLAAALVGFVILKKVLARFGLV